MTFGSAITRDPGLFSPGAPPVVEPPGGGASGGGSGSGSGPGTTPPPTGGGPAPTPGGGGTGGTPTGGTSSGSINVPAGTTPAPFNGLTILGQMPQPGALQDLGAGISAQGTLANPIRNLTITNCVIRGFRLSIYIRFCINVTISNNLLTDADYAGVAGFSIVGGTIDHNTIQRIGYVRTDMSSVAFGNNAYGVMLNRNESSSTVSDPPSSNVRVEYNLIEDVPLWMGINAHAGNHMSYSYNTIRRCCRAIFIAGSPTGGGVTKPTDFSVLGNLLEFPVTKSGGSSDIEGILYASVVGIRIDLNQVDRAYGSPNGFDYGGNSTGVVIGTNTSIH